MLAGAAAIWIANHGECLVVMPYQAYQLYQIERPKSPAEIRLADEQLGRAAERLSRLWRRAAEPIGVGSLVRSASQSDRRAFQAQTQSD